MSIRSLRIFTKKRYLKVMFSPAHRAVTAAVLTVIAALAAPASASAAASPPGAGQPASLGPGLGPPPAQATPGGESACAASAFQAGFSYSQFVATSAGHYRQMTVAIAVCLAESGGRSNVYGCNMASGEVDGYYPPVSCPSGTSSYDRGMWQLNNVAQSYMSNPCAFQAQCNADGTWSISGHGVHWSPWSTYSSGAWTGYLPDAEAALSGYTVVLDGNASGKCLNSPDGAHDGTALDLWTCDSASSHQQWRVVLNGQGDPMLESVASGRCLDTIAGQGRDGGGVQLWSCHSWDQHQLWHGIGSGRLDPGGDASVVFENDGSAHCLSTKAGDGVNGGVVYQWDCGTSNPYEQWH
jgi:Ricin-type beta-trefoil lectin domain/Lysozyme like domain